VSSECDGRWLDSRGTAWDASEPLNRIYAGSGGGPETAARGALVAAGPSANDVATARAPKRATMIPAGICNRM
jgi:hypothetical protein